MTTSFYLGLAFGTLGGAYLGAIVHGLATGRGWRSDMAGTLLIALGSLGAGLTMGWEREFTAPPGPVLALSAALLIVGAFVDVRGRPFHSS